LAEGQKATPEAVRGHKLIKVMNEIKLGDKVRSKVSGFSGTVTAVCHYLHSDTHYAVTPTVNPDGKVNVTWFALAELEPTE
jgi:preprotein translocase subunit YajC